MTQEIKTEDIGSIGYSSKDVSIEELYNTVLTKKDLLEEHGYNCSWMFVDVGNGGELFLGNTDLSDLKDPKPLIRVATLHKDSHFSTLLFYLPNKNKAYIYGSTKIEGDKSKYEKLIETIDQLNSLTGMELRIEYH